jgi:hypothetical protein
MNKFAHGLPDRAPRGEASSPSLPKDLYKGMRVRPSMDMIVNYIEKDPYKIKYPNRDATFYLNSPQFLNLLNDSGLDLEEQSKNLAKQQLMQSQRRASGLGGAVDTALSGSDVEAGSDGFESVSSGGLSAYRRRVEQDLERVREQERVRQENEERYRRQQESFERARQERERSFELAARRSLASSSAHPVASASAAAAAQSYTIPPAFLGQIAQQFLQRSGVTDIPITYLQPPVPQAITPIRPQMIRIEVPQPQPPTDVRYSENEESTKRARVEPKAKAEPASGASSSSASASASTPSIPVKTRTDLDRGDEWRLRKELKELLSSAEYNVDDIRKKFRDKYPAVRNVGGKALSSARKKDVIDEYIERMKGGRDAAKEIRGMKEELRRRRAAIPFDS